MSVEIVENLSNEVSLPPYVINDLSPIRTQSETIDWCMNTLQIPRIRAEFGLTGKGVKVAVIDTGCHIDHEDLKGAVLSHHNVTNEAYAWTNGHSTGVSSLIGARQNDLGIQSVAPNCQIIAIKALAESGSGSLNDIVKGIDLAVSLGAHVINMSLGGNQGIPELERAVNNAVSKGIHVICAAGNSGGENTVGWPARYAETVAVGATNQNNQSSAFTSRGPEVDIAAPGERILVAWKNGGYATVSGTCIRGDQWVHTENGYKEISKIEIGDKVYTLNEITQQLELKPVTNKISNGIKTVYNVKTTNGEIVCTDNHPFLTGYVGDDGQRNEAGQRSYNKGLKWTQLVDMKVDDIVVMSQIKRDSESSISLLNSLKSKLPYFNLDTAYAMGYWLGDGWYGTNSLVVYAKINFWNDLVEKFIKAFPECEVYNTFREDRNEYNIHVKGSNIKDLFTSFGFKSGAKNKEIPEFVFGLPTEYREALLAGLFDSDGTINEYDGGRNAALKVSSKKLAKGFKKLMESMNIRCSNIYTQEPRESFIKGRLIKGSESYSSTTYQFYKLQSIKEHLLDERYVDVLDNNNDDYLSQNSVGRVKINGIKVRPPKLDNDDLYFGKITEIREIGQDEVWDITVEDNHNFLCENFVVHNSFASPLMAGCYALFVEAGIKVSHTILRETAIDIEETGFDHKSGFGLFNPYEIIKKYRKVETSCNPIGGYRITNVTDNSLTIQWDGLLLAGVRYSVSAYEGNRSLFVNKTVSNSTIDVTGLNSNTSYLFKIKTVCPNGNLSDERVIDVKTLDKQTSKIDLTDVKSAISGLSSVLSQLNNFIDKNK